MVWHALDSLEESLAATRRLLLPFRLRRWLVLAVVVFFVSGSSGINTGINLDPGVFFRQPSAPEPIPIDEGPIGGAVDGVAATGAPPRLALALLAVVVLLLVALVFWYVASVMEFVLVEIARRRDVRIRGFFGDATRKGLSLFGFRLAVGIAVLAAALVFVGLTVATGGVFLLIALLFSPLLVVAVIGVWALLRFTTDFVVPVMLAEDVGVLAGWRAFWPALRADWKQYGVYAAVRFLVGIAASVVVGIGFAILGIALAIPFGIVGVGGYLLLADVLALSTIGFAFGVAVAVLFLVTLVIAGTTLVQVPVETYLRYYGLLVLGAVTPAYDLVSDLRDQLGDDGGPASTG